MQRAAGCTVSAVASRDAERARAWADRHGVPHAYGGYQSLLESGAVDAVYVPLPNALHADWTVAALDAGLPVLCEKPLTTNLADAIRVQKAATAAGLPVVEAFMYRHQPVYALLGQLLDSGEWGTLRSIDGVFTFALDEHGSVIASQELGGGALLDVGCYPVDAIRWLGGAEPVQVSAAARIDGVDRAMVGVLELENGVLGRFETAIDTAEVHRLELGTSKARIVVDDPWVPTTDVTVRVLVRGEPEIVHTVPCVDAYRVQAERFAAVVRGEVAPERGLTDAVATARALEALAAAARTGAAVRVRAR